MNAVVVDKSAQEPLPGYRTKMSAFASKHPATGWGYDPFNGFPDLLPSLTLAQGPAGPTVIEIIAHGSPTNLQDIGSGTIAKFASNIAKKFPTASEVYLTGCNTGLSLGGYCVADELSRLLHGVTVYGAAGYVTKGAAASKDAETSRDDGGNPFAHSRNDVHPTCWNRFHRPPSLSRLSQPSVQPSPQIAPENVLDAISEALRVNDQRDLPPLLIGPDVSGIVDLPDGQFKYELLGGGSILRNAVSRQTFDFPRGAELFERWLGPSR